MEIKEKNEIICQLLERKSVRVFKDRDISSEDREAILQSIMEAPTAGNQQLYTILDITDQDLKEKLAEVCDHQPFIAKAKMVLVFLADCKKWYDAYLDTDCTPRKPGVGDLMLAVTDTAIAAQNGVTAAWSLGIGSCYIGDIMENCEEVRNLLHLPEYVFPAAMLVFGHPTEQQKERQKPRRSPMEKIVYKNYYPQMNAKMRQELLGSSLEGQAYEQWMKAFCNRKYNSDFSREMTRSVAAYLSQFERNEEQNS